MCAGCCAVYNRNMITSLISSWKLTVNCNQCVFNTLLKRRIYSSMSSYTHVKRIMFHEQCMFNASSQMLRHAHARKCPPMLCSTGTPSNKHDLCKKTYVQNKNVKQTLIRDVLKEKKDRIKESSQTLLQDIRETKNKMKEKMEEVVERENVMTIPNLLCVSRIIVSPYLGYVITQSDFKLALGLFAFAGVTDLIDGWVARTYPTQATKIGSFLDPMADKILVAILFVTLTYMKLIPVPLTALIIVRDLFLVIAGFYIRYQSLPPPKTLSRYFDVTYATAQLAPTFISKVNTAVQLTLVATTLAAPVFTCIDYSVIHTLWYVTAVTTVASACSYIFSRNTYKYLKPKKK